MVNHFDWQKQAACANPDYDPEWWFAPKDSPEATAAQAICMYDCPVYEQCENTRATSTCGHQEESQASGHAAPTVSIGVPPGSRNQNINTTRIEQVLKGSDMNGEPEF